MMAWLRSALFAGLQALLTVLFSLVALASAPFPPRRRHALITGYTRAVIALARSLLGIRYVVEGQENLPAAPAVVMAKHQSTWETFALVNLLPPSVQIIKRELLDIPFFGWGFRMLSPIAIDRAAGREALKQIATQGRARLGDGFWVLVFPEGTRVAPGEKGRYGIGGGWLAAETGAPIVPVAHNAGELWPRGAFVKRAGCITVRIGPAIDPTGKSAAELTRAVEAWIEAEMGRLPPARGR